MALFDRTTTLSGDVAYLRFIMSWPIEEAFREDKAWDVMQHRKQELDAEVRESVKKHLGTEFEVRGITMLRGSIEIIIVIGTTYYAVSKYKNFIDSIDLLKAQVKKVIKRIVDPQDREPMTITDSWTPGPTLASADASSQALGSSDPTKMILLIYLVLSHAALLTIFLWLVVKSQ